MEQNITKQHVYDLGVTPSNMIKLGKLTKTDYEGIVDGLRLFDKLTLETAIDEVVNQIVKDFTIGKMIEIIYNYDENFDIDCIGSKWYLDTRCQIPNINIDDTKLIDVLWSAIKIIINITKG